ncbi:hypothetical protein VTO73DRAFT_12514 [Trametes versicolor]
MIRRVRVAIAAECRFARESSLHTLLDVTDSSLAQPAGSMLRNKFTSSAFNSEHIERKPTPSQTIVHRWEVTYTCNPGDESQPPSLPVVVYSRQGGSDADTPRPALHIAVESADVQVKRELADVGATILGKRARSPLPTVASRSAQTNAASGASYTTAYHTPGNDPALRRQTGTNKPRGKPPKRQYDTDRRRSASPHRRSDGFKPAKRAEDMASWKPKLRTRKIRGCDESTEWSESRSEDSIRAVPDALLQIERGRHGRPLSMGHLHLHVHKRGVQTWMLVSGTVAVRRERDSGWGSAGNAPKGVRSANPEPQRIRKWIPATIGTKHPCLRGYVLHFLDSGEPGFVLEASARNYAAGRKERKRRKSIA